MTDGNNFAMPIFEANEGGLYSSGGLTKREYIATEMMAALIANPERYKYITEKMRSVLVPGQSEPLRGMSQADASAKNANKAVMLADALIEALNK